MADFGLRRHTGRALLMLVLAAGAGACAAGSGAERGQSYADAVEELYEGAEKAVRGKDWMEATRRLNIVRTQYPFSRYAALAELRLGDVYFEQEQHASAVEQYRSFVRLHPQHELQVEAQFRIARAFYAQIPEDWWFMPPAFEKDLSRVNDAVRELQIFLTSHADSPQAGQARPMLLKARRRLADHELYVARFYVERQKPKAAVGRLTSLLRQYPGLGLDAEALLMLGKAHLALGDVTRARTAWEDLVQVHPQHPLAGEAQRHLQGNPIPGGAKPL